MTPESTLEAEFGDDSAAENRVPSRSWRRFRPAKREPFRLYRGLPARLAAGTR